MHLSSGCGKTTLLNILAGQKSLTDGVLTVNGAPLPKHFRRLVGCALAPGLATKGMPQLIRTRARRRHTG